VIHSNFEVPFNLPALNLRAQTDSMAQKFLELLEKGPYLNGPHLADFEENFSQYLSVGYCFGVSSGTSALEIAFKSLELTSDSEVLVAANSGGYSTVALLNSKLQPRFYDVERNGLIDFKKLESSVTPKSRALVVTHLYGQMCDMVQLSDFCNSFNLFLIEDCAQSLGSTFNGHHLGSFGDLACFSFYPTKNLATIGDAGAIATNRSELASRIESLRQYGWKNRYSIEINGGSNFRMDEIHALCVFSGIENLSTQIDQRRSIWNRYNNVLTQYDGSLLSGSVGDAAPHLATLRVSQRARFMRYFSDNLVATAVHYPVADYDQPAFIGLFDQNFSSWETSDICNQVVSIPLFPTMSQLMIGRVEEILDQYVKDNQVELR
jgi:dTDP-4-amino-4,6-dideoxygalactose transaminase